MERREIFLNYYYHIAFRDKFGSENGGKWTVIPSSLFEWYADRFYSNGKVGVTYLQNV